MLAWHAGVGGALGLAAALLVFAGLRQVGYPVALTDVIWPPAWGEINRARADFFYARAVDAFQSGDVNTTVSALSLAHGYDPDHLAAGMMLATIWQSARPESADAIYLRLLQAHPAAAPEIARAWYRALLYRGDFAEIEQLAGRALRFDAENWAVWLHALLFANRHTGTGDVLETVLREGTALPTEARAVLELEAQVRSAADDEARRRLLLATPPDGASASYETLYRVRRLLGLGAARDALDLLYETPMPANNRDWLALELDALAQLGFERPRRTTIGRLLPALPDPAALNLIACHLIRHPERALFDQVLQRFRGTIDRPGINDYPSLVTLFCVAVADGDNPTIARLAEALKASTASRFDTMDAVMRYFTTGAQGPIGSILPILNPPDLDIVYATLDHFAPIPTAEAATKPVRTP